MHDRTFWGAAAISIVVVSWVLYHYLAPRTWREWTRAGVLQAFLIAFYAEMYGFPLTLYAITRVFGLDAEGGLWRGNLWVYLTGIPQIMYVSMFVGYAVAALGIMLIIIAWRQLHLGAREGRLVTQGAYAYMRHPQYTGLFLAVLGEGVIHWPTVFSLVAFPVIVIAYAWLARSEERQLLSQYGDDYRRYCSQTPMFIPRVAAWRSLIRWIASPGPGGKAT